jgi:hypothetical protein
VCLGFVKLKMGENPNQNLVLKIVKAFLFLFLFPMAFGPQ